MTEFEEKVIDKIQKNFDEWIEEQRKRNEEQLKEATRKYEEQKKACRKLAFIWSLLGFIGILMAIIVSC